jgi:hypothetical protein
MSGLTELINQRIADIEDIKRIKNATNEELLSKLEVKIKEVVPRFVKTAIDHMSAETLKKDSINLYLRINNTEFNSPELTVFDPFVSNQVKMFNFNKKIPGIASTFENCIRKVIKDELGAQTRKIDYRGNCVIVFFVFQREQK